MKPISLLLCVLCVSATLREAHSASSDRPNILFIAADDLRPQFGCYGYDWMHTPNVDALAARGIVFENAYCQSPVCRASRVSLMTGMRPDSTEVWTNGSRHKTFRNHSPDITTLPQQFHNHGYHSQAFGKMFHGCFVVRAKWYDRDSWSVPSWFPSPRYYYSEEGVRVARNIFAKKTGAKGAAVDDWVHHFILGLSHEAPDVDDDVLQDGQVALRGIEALRDFKKNRPGQPFFLGLGFLKPHLPFIAPKKYWDMYPEERIVVAPNLGAPVDAPPMAATSWGHPRSYSDFPGKGDPSPELLMKLTRGYAACVSYVDAQLGRVLDELDRLGLADNTIVILWGDHGWHVGENHIFGKATNFEMSAHVPLILSDPRAKNKGLKTKALVEFVDIFPTLCDLSGVPLPDHLEGTSMAPLLENPDADWKTAAFTEYPSSIGGKHDGHSMRTPRYRLIRWTKQGDNKTTAALELYDHDKDPRETVNIANHPENAELIKRLTTQLASGWQSATPPEN